MKPEEEFDDIFRRKSEEAGFSFRESDWEKARVMIDKSRMGSAASTSAKLYWVASAIVLITSSALLYLALPVVQQSSNPDEVVEESERKLNQPLAAKSVSENSAAPAKKNLIFGQLNLPGSVIAESAGTEGNSPSGQKTQDKEINPSDLKQVPEFPAESGNSPGLANGNEEHVLAITGGMFTDHSEETAEESEIHSVPPISSQEDKLTVLPVHNGNLLAGFYTKPELNPKLVYLKRYNEDYYTAKKTPQNFVDIEIGAIYFGGWSNGNSTTADGLNAFSGLNFGHYFSKHFAVSAGLQTYNIGHMDQIFHINTSIDYSFGSVYSQTVMTCNSMLFAAVPLKAYYVPDKNHMLGLGINAAYLVSAKNTIESYEYADGVKQNVQTSKSTTLYQGMSPANIIINVSLLKRFNNRFSAQLELDYGLSDLFNDTELNSYSQNSTGIRISMNYRIFNK